MAKKKRAGATKRGTRKKAASPSKKRAAAGPPSKLRLQHFRPLVEKSLSKMGPATEPYSEKRMRLQRMMDDMDWFCDENNPEGCGPHMIFPLP